MSAAILLSHTGEALTVYKWAAVIAEESGKNEKTIRGRLYAMMRCGRKRFNAYGRGYVVVSGAL